MFHHLHIGIYACDSEAYETFKEVFDQVIKEYHKVGSGEIKHPPVTFGDINNLPFGDLDPERKYIKSTRVRVGRSVHGMPFPPLINLKVRFLSFPQICVQINILFYFQCC